jgi:hypothetical protein
MLMYGASVILCLWCVGSICDTYYAYVWSICDTMLMVRILCASTLSYMTEEDSKFEC